MMDSEQIISEQSEACIETNEENIQIRPGAMNLGNGMLIGDAHVNKGQIS